MFLSFYCSKICRADHTMDDLREKIFPCKGRKEKEPETTHSASVSSPTKRKERSLSSLEIDNTYTTSDSATMKMLSKSTAQENLAEQQCVSTTIVHSKPIFDQNKQNNTQVMERKTVDLNKKEEATVTSSNDCNIQDNTIAKAETIQIDDNYCNVQEHGHKPIMERVESGSYGTSPSIEHGILQDVSRERRLASSNGSSGKLQDPIGDIDADGRCNMLSNPIWFALVASNHQ